MNLNTVVLLSGGMDSAACAHHLQTSGHHVHGVFVDYGQRAAVPEQRAAEQLSSGLGIELSVVQVKTQQSFGTGENAGRNAFLVFCALLNFGHQRMDAIALGIHAGTNYYDCSRAFLACRYELFDRITA